MRIFLSSTSFRPDLILFKWLLCSPFRTRFCRRVLSHLSLRPVHVTLLTLLTHWTITNVAIPLTHWLEAVPISQLLRPDVKRSQDHTRKIPTDARTYSICLRLYGILTLLDRVLPLSQIPFIFIQFSRKICPENKLAPPSWKSCTHHWSRIEVFTENDNDNINARNGPRISLPFGVKIDLLLQTFHLQPLITIANGRCSSCVFFYLDFSLNKLFVVFYLDYYFGNFFKTETETQFEIVISIVLSDCSNI